MVLRDMTDRLGTGERWWAAEFAVRAAGLALLAACALATLWLYRSVHQPPTHQANALELVAATVVVVGGCGGCMLTFVGPTLFEQVPIPNRAVSRLTIGDNRNE